MVKTIQKCLYSGRIPYKAEKIHRVKDLEILRIFERIKATEDCIIKGSITNID
jgi:hypothetical protein